MAKITQTSQVIDKMIRFFLPFCTEQSTMLELRDMAPQPKQWREAHKLFGRIRDKTLKAKDYMLLSQYSFEEICAKTLYNLADHHAGFSAEYLPPFDEDAPFWVVPIAIHFARALGVTDFDSVSPTLAVNLRPRN